MRPFLTVLTLPFLGALVLAQTAPAPTTLSATFSVPRSATAAEGVAVEITVKNAGAADQVVSFGRSSAQNCAFAPHVRVLKVGTREVVYPSGEPRICTQELRGETVPAGGEAKFTRTLDLAPGEYMIEGWAKGFAGDAQVFLPGEPGRVSVK